MAQSQTQSKFTSLNVTRDLADRVDELKPYPSMSNSDLLDEALDVWERHRGDSE